MSVKVARELDQRTNAHHVSNRPPWKDDTADELADEVEAAVLVRDSHDYTHGYKKESGNGKGEQ